MRGNTRTHTVTDLTPYTNYNLVIKAFNNGGEGPASTEVRAETEEAGKSKMQWMNEWMNNVINVSRGLHVVY